MGTSAEGDKKKDEKKEKKKPASEEKMALEKRMEEYRVQLKQEFGYSDKDIKADPALQTQVNIHNRFVSLGADPNFCLRVSRTNIFSSRTFLSILGIWTDAPLM